MPRHIHIRVLVLSIEPKFGSQGSQRLLQFTNEALMKSEQLVGIPTE